MGVRTTGNHANEVAAVDYIANYLLSLVRETHDPSLLVEVDIQRPSGVLLLALPLVDAAPLSGLTHPLSPHSPH